MPSTEYFLLKAIKALDATFSKENAKRHGKHIRELGASGMQEYKSKAKWLSEQPIGGNIGGYTRKDGRQVRYNKQTYEYVVFTGNTVVTFYKIRPQQLQREIEANRR